MVCGLLWVKIKNPTDFRLIVIMIQYEIVHHIPGRLRLKLDKSDLIKSAEEKIRQIVEVTTIRINPLANSIILQYNPKKQNPEDFQHILAHTLKEIAESQIVPESKLEPIIPEKKESRQPRKPRTNSPRKRKPNV
jgi:hypothetical protein